MQKANAPVPFKMELLYNEILSQYQVRLEREEKQGRIPPNKSEDIIKRTKEILKDYQYLLKTSYRSLLNQQERENKQKTLRDAEEQQNIQNIEKIEENLEQEVIEDEFAFMDNEDKNLQKIDDEAGDQKKEVDIVKKQENVSEVEEQSENNNEYQQTKKLRKFVLANLDACFQGVFISSRKKYIAKSQRTRFDLQNVFVKFKDRENLYKMVTCDLNTVKTEEVKINYNI